VLNSAKFSTSESADKIHFWIPKFFVASAGVPQLTLDIRWTYVRVRKIGGDGTCSLWLREHWL